MSIKTILAYLPSEKAAAPIIEAASKIAAKYNGHIIGFHLVPEFPLYGEYPGEVSDSVRQNFEAAAQRASNVIQGVFTRATLPEGVTREWRSGAETYLYGSDRLLREVRTVDLVVCVRFDPDAPDAWGDFAELALMHGGRPVLHVAASAVPKTMGERVLLAWNDTREAARAAFDAMDFLKAAQQVSAVTLIQHEDERAAAEISLKHLTENLRRQDITISGEVSLCKASSGEALLKHAKDRNCDLLVMGGYSHSRLRELFLGGVSREIIRDTAIPVLMSH